jgi:hypothetical protein
VQVGDPDGDPIRRASRRLWIATSIVSTSAVVMIRTWGIRAGYPSESPTAGGGPTGLALADQPDHHTPRLLNGERVYPTAEVQLGFAAAHRSRLPPWSLSAV